MIGERTTFRCVDNDVVDTYTMPIWDAIESLSSQANYAVVEAVDHNVYAVTPCSRYDEAQVTAYSRRNDGAIGIRIYLRRGGWIGQVHYLAESFDGQPERPWPDEWECWRLAEREHTRLLLRLR